MHRPALVVAIVLLQTRAFQRPPRHVQSLAPVRAAAADDVNALMTQLNAAVQQEDFRKAAELKKRLCSTSDGVVGSSSTHIRTSAMLGALEWMARGRKGGSGDGAAAAPSTPASGAGGGAKVRDLLELAPR